MLQYYERKQRQRKDAIMVTVAGCGLAECPGQAVYKMLVHQ